MPDREPPHGDAPAEASPEAWPTAEAAARGALAEAGLDLCGVLGVATWDALVPPPLRAAELLPGAAAAWVVGGGGDFLARALAADGEHPVDAATERCVGAAAEALGAAVVWAHRPRAGAVADFVALGRAAGLGWPSRLGLLLHPRRGPWIHLRAALLVRATLPPSAPLPGPGPCAGCPAPCAAACPVAAPRPEGFDVRACSARRRVDPGCRASCAARRACPVGEPARYTAPALAHVMEASLAAVLAHADRPPGA